MHTEGEDASFAISPFTYDADFALDPELLGGSPAIVEAMSRAGFRLGDQPGLYSREGRSQVDLLVPEAVGGPGRRAARLGAHGNRAAMKVHGLEGALVSHTVRKITSLVPGADRSCFLKVAGPAALLVSKVHKIGERLEEPDVRRQEQLPKDAFDIYRLLRAIDTAELAYGVRTPAVARDFEPGDLRGVVDVSEPRFGSRVRHGHRASWSGPFGALEDPAFIIESSVALSRDLLEAISE